MSRSMWFSAGVAFGVYGFVKTKRAAQTLTPSGLLARAAAARAGARVLSDAVLVGMREREAELRDHRMEAHGRDQLDAGADARPQLGSGRPEPQAVPEVVDGHR